MPIPDYRTIADAGVVQPSADLLDTIFDCQQRQDWYRSFAQIDQHDRVAFVGSVTRETDVGVAAATMRTALGFEVGERGSTFTAALSLLAESRPRSSASS